MLGGCPRPENVVVGARVVWLQPLQPGQEVPWDRAGTSCCSPTLAPPAQLRRPLYLKAHHEFLFLTVLPLLVDLLKLLPSIPA